MAALEKMELRQVINGRAVDPPFVVVFNPSGLSDHQEVLFNDSSPIGSAKLAKDFYQVASGKTSFTFTLDSTGAATPESEPVREIEDMVREIKTITQTYEGTIHEPPWVEVSWGDFVFRGRTTSLNIDYTLFKPSGKPLRAKVQLEIDRSVSKEEEQLMKNASSPDLTHIVVVKAGDTLPLLCQRVYGDGGYYLDIAAYNNVVHFRDLRPGLELMFPPLSQ